MRLNPVGILVAGLVVVFVGSIVVSIGSLGSASQGSVAGVIFIGPFPIVFGSGPGSQYLILIGLVIVIAMALISLLSFFLARRRA